MLIFNCDQILVSDINSIYVSKINDICIIMQISSIFHLQRKILQMVSLFSRPQIKGPLKVDTDSSKQTVSDYLLQYKR